jgi:3-oxoacyl-[acyl-carrier-protein] synthase-3
MGAVITAVAIAVPVGRTPPSSKALAVDAGREALRRAGREPDEVAFLVNAGFYRDRHFPEPANAASVQQGLGANPAWKAVRGTGTLAFDVVNGACGMLSGAQVVDNLMSGRPGLGLVVASDVAPSPRESESYPYEPMGAAVLLARGAPDEGFQAFAFRTYPQVEDLASGILDWSKAGPALHVHEEPAFIERGFESAVDTVGSFLAEQDCDPAEIDLVVSWPFPPAALQEPLGLRADAVDLHLPVRRVLTAGIALALEAAQASEHHTAAHRLLFVAVGSGITVATALYEAPRGEAP